MDVRRLNCLLVCDMYIHVFCMSEHGVPYPRIGTTRSGWLKTSECKCTRRERDKAHGGGLENCGRRDCLVLLVGDGISDALLWF